MSVILILILLFVGCSCTHEWEDATCTTPKTCTKCGKTEGEPLGHTWQEATCTAPKTCSVCGATEGKASGHDWQAATTTKPVTCTKCGLTRGNPLPNYDKTTQYVVKGYNSAIDYAKSHDTKADYAYNDIRNRLVKLNSAAYMDNSEEVLWQAWALFSGDFENMSTRQLQLKAQKILNFIVPKDEDYLSALMKQFNKMSSVSGTITPTKVDITVKNMDAFVKEIGLKDTIVGGMLAVLEIYDYSWLDPDSPKLLQFTETGFTFHWQAVGEYSLKLN